MKTSKIILSVAAAISLNTLSAADDISAILNQIQVEGSGAKNTNIEKTNSGSSSTSTPKKKQSSTSSKKNTSSTPKTKQPAAKQIVVWGPTDKLPKDVIGQGVAGNFALRGEDLTGSIELVPASEASNPFARVFVVSNLTSRLPSGTLLPINQRKLVPVSANRPLIFTGRGPMLGYYTVEYQ